MFSFIAHVDHGLWHRPWCRTRCPSVLLVVFVILNRGALTCLCFMSLTEMKKLTSLCPDAKTQQSESCSHTHAFHVIATYNLKD